jgi:uncharacterized membrane protein
MGRIESFIAAAWKAIKRHRVRSIVLASAIVLVLILAYQRIVLGWVAWAPETGFREYWVTKVNPTTNEPTEKEIHYRTTWDWLDLLIVPVVLGLGASILPVAPFCL